MYLVDPCLRRDEVRIIFYAASVGRMRVLTNVRCVNRMGITSLVVGTPTLKIELPGSGGFFDLIFLF